VIIVSSGNTHQENVSNVKYFSFLQVILYWYKKTSLFVGAFACISLKKIQTILGGMKKGALKKKNAGQMDDMLNLTLWKARYSECP